jgi:hypothetical protein
MVIIDEKRLQAMSQSDTTARSNGDSGREPNASFEPKNACASYLAIRSVLTRIGLKANRAKGRSEVLCSSSEL